MYGFRVQRWIKYLVLALLLAMGGGPGWLGRPAPLRRTAIRAGCGRRAAANRGGVSAIRHIDLVHLSHTDVGFTDHPIVCRELQRRYLDIAIDAVLATQTGPNRPASAGRPRARSASTTGGGRPRPNVARIF